MVEVVDELGAVILTLGESLGSVPTPGSECWFRPFPSTVFSSSPHRGPQLEGACDVGCVKSISDHAVLLPSGCGFGSYGSVR